MPDFTRIYALLSDHPDGMTVAQLQVEMAEGWMATDAYRAYQQHLQKNRQSVLPRATANTISEYGTPQFIEHAQTWWIKVGHGPGPATPAGERFPFNPVPVLAINGNVHHPNKMLKGHSAYAERPLTVFNAKNG